jgi:hypothetical protein
MSDGNINQYDKTKDICTNGISHGPTKYDKVPWLLNTIE